MTRRLSVPALALSLGLMAGCARPPVAAPRDAYRVSVGLNNGLALILDAAAIVKRAEVTRDARGKMAACPPLPQGKDCRVGAVQEAMGNGAPAFEKIDKATKLQHDLAETLRTLETCAADKEKMPDAACEVGLLKQALEKLPALVEAVQAVREHAQATSPNPKDISQ